MATIFSFIKDNSGNDSSRYFLSDDTGFREASASDVVAVDDILISHDYWMICGELFKHTGKLPTRVVDLDEYRVFTSKRPGIRKEREKHDLVEYIKNHSQLFIDTAVRYKKIFYAEADVVLSVIDNFHQLLLFYYIEICRLAFANGEFSRFFDIELPCQRIAAEITALGIPISTEKLSEFKADASHEYYLKLKYISDTFNVPLQVPNRTEIDEFAISKKVDLKDYSHEFVFNYHPAVREFAKSVTELRELNTTRGVLNSVAVKSKRVHPIVDTQGSRTSRLSLSSPYLQNIAKKYRSIIVADKDMDLCYVDFDQFEVGIMAALSRDPKLLELYAMPDMYESFQIEHLKGEGNRKSAKVLFLAYAYGMKLKHLQLVGLDFNIKREVIKNAFKPFKEYEKWKLRNFDALNHKGYVSTSFGNRFYKKNIQVSVKDKLSAISQVVQGEGSLIFKKTLLQLAETEDVGILLPMHDALLFQHALPATPQKVCGIFENMMTSHFNGLIQGKASIEEFCSSSE